MPLAVCFQCFILPPSLRMWQCLSAPSLAVQVVFVSSVQMKQLEHVDSVRARAPPALAKCWGRAPGAPLSAPRLEQPVHRRQLLPVGTGGSNTCHPCTGLAGGTVRVARERPTCSDRCSFVCQVCVQARHVWCGCNALHWAVQASSPQHHLLSLGCGCTGGPALSAMTSTTCRPAKLVYSHTVSWKGGWVSWKGVLLLALVVTCC